jgi:OHCU decarboxylase
LISLANLNRCDRDDFVAAVGFAFEHSPWIAERAWARRPFGSLDALHDGMTAVVEAASAEEKLALIAAHPDLAGRVAREGRLTSSSRDEQAAAGLDALSADEVARFERLNAVYRARFGFPFVICAREHDKSSILDELERRSNHERAAEIATALAEVAKIAKYRLEALRG